MECPICSYEFDDNKRKSLLCKCGNSICEDCINALVTRSNGSFICPLCRYTRSQYHRNKLPQNKQVIKLIQEIDCIRNPTKDKCELTEPLVYRSAYVQSSDFERPKEFNEYITVLGISVMISLFLPWVYIT